MITKKQYVNPVIEELLLVGYATSYQHEGGALFLGALEDAEG